MTVPEPAIPAETAESFAAFTERLREHLDAQDGQALGQAIASFLAENPPPGQRLLVEATWAFCVGQFAQAVETFQQVPGLLAPADLPGPDALYSALYVRAQLALPANQRLARRQAYLNLKHNLAALAKKDPDLATHVRAAAMPDNFDIVDLWGKLHLWHASGVLQVLQPDVRGQLDAQVRDLAALTFAGLATDRLLCYCLDHQHVGLHGMTRAHYLFLPEVAELRALLQLRDCSREIASEELLIFAGPDMAGAVARVFATHRYALPRIIYGDTTLVLAQIGKLDLDVHTVRDRVADYYASQEFARRQRDIKAGALQPRILVSTCRWTTFLRHCAADFQRAFDRLGCQTRYLIEDNDVQRTSNLLIYETLDRFRPDAVFMVSHGRPGMTMLPPQLPMITYLQDRVGQIDAHDDLSALVEPHDLFVCQARTFVDYLAGKAVPPRQTIVMPVPVDPEVFHPLDPPPAEADRVDLSFVKHGGPGPDVLFQRFLAGSLHALPGNVAAACATILTRLYAHACDENVRHLSETDMQRFLRDAAGHDTTDQGRRLLDFLAVTFNVTVYSNLWRCRFLEALAQAGLDVHLYGNHWDQHPVLAPFGRGPVDRGADLNRVYNATRINLHLNPVATMHQRLVECALAGGFLMIADLDDKDWEPARSYFDEPELVFFRTPAELVDRARHFLAHPDQRADLAQRLHRRALANHTLIPAARRVLDAWRELLQPA